MPQGKLKAKVQIPSASKKKGKVTKQSSIKHKGRVIAPKKAKLAEKFKLKKALTQTINKQIEKEVILQAGKQNVGLKVVESKAKNNRNNALNDCDDGGNPGDSDFTDAGETPLAEVPSPQMWDDVSGGVRTSTRQRKPVDRYGAVPYV